MTKPKKDPALETADKAASKTAAKSAVKTASKAARNTVSKQSARVYLQYEGCEWETAEVLERIRAAYLQEGHRASSLKALTVYLKPEEHKAYYVINESVTGSVDL